MSDYITVENLDEIVEQNKLIKKSIEEKLNMLYEMYNAKEMIKSESKFAFNFLKKNGLIQIPISNKHWGGAIYYVDGKKIPVINTALPRLNQYFIAWHEIYHLLYEDWSCSKVYKVSTEPVPSERCADYFAAKAMLGNVYQYYLEIKKEDFLDKIAMCMDSYQAPYKAIMIQLYEEAKACNDSMFQQLIMEYFDRKNIDWRERFQKLGLDEEAVMASNVIYLGDLEEKIQKRMIDEPDVSAHEINKKYLEDLKERIKKDVGRG